MRGSGVSFRVADGTGKWIEFHKDRDREGDYTHSGVSRNESSAPRHESGWSSTDADVEEGGTSGGRSGARLRIVEEEVGEMV